MDDTGGGIGAERWRSRIGKDGVRGDHRMGVFRFYRSLEDRKNDFPFFLSFVDPAAREALFLTYKVLEFIPEFESGSGQQIVAKLPRLCISLRFTWLLWHPCKVWLSNGMLCNDGCFAMMVGPDGRTVGVEHIPGLVTNSIENISRSAASELLKNGTT